MPEIAFIFDEHGYFVRAEDGDGRSVATSVAYEMTDRRGGRVTVLVAGQPTPEAHEDTPQLPLRSLARLSEAITDAGEYLNSAAAVTREQRPAQLADRLLEAFVRLGGALGYRPPTPDAVGQVRKAVEQAVARPIAAEKPTMAQTLEQIMLYVRAVEASGGRISSLQDLHIEPGKVEGSMWVATDPDRVTITLNVTSAGGEPGEAGHGTGRASRGEPSP